VQVCTPLPVTLVNPIAEVMVAVGRHRCGVNSRAYLFASQHMHRFGHLAVPERGQALRQAVSRGITECIPSSSGLILTTDDADSPTT
jgi:hypothetical protein